MFWHTFRRLGRFLRPGLVFGWPWLVLSVVIKTWTWALASRGSDDAIPALVITIFILAGPFFETQSPEKAWRAIEIVVGVATVSFAVITWLAPHLAAEASTRLPIPRPMTRITLRPKCHTGSSSIFTLRWLCSPLSPLGARSSLSRGLGP